MKYKLLKRNEYIGYFISLFLVVSFLAAWPSYLWYGGWLGLYLNLIWRAYLLYKIEAPDSELVIQKGVTILITIGWTLLLLILLVFAVMHYFKF